jgi:putative Mn2+ efflux pump MntP
MLSAIWVSTLLGMDSFVVSLGLGPLVRGRNRYAIASAFGLCDGAAILFAPLFSTSFAGAISSLEERALPVLVIAYAIYVVALTRNARALAQGWAGWLVLPVATSIDNLAAGPLASSTVSIGMVAFFCAFISAAMSLAALAIGETVQKRVPMDPGHVAAAGFLLAAGFLIA